MANNEDTQMPQEVLLKTGEAEENPYASVLQQELDKQRQAVRVSFRLAAPKDPDHQAKVMKLAQQSALPPSIVDRNYEEIQKGEYFKQADALVTKAPTLSSFVSNPNNAALAKDDLDHLKKVEDTVKEHHEDSKIIADLFVGLNNIGAMAAKTPAFAADVGLNSLNNILRTTGHLDQGEEGFVTPESWKDNALSKYFEENAKFYQGKVPELDQSAIEALSDETLSTQDRIAKSSRIIFHQFVANAPMQAALMASYYTGFGTVGLVTTSAMSGAQEDSQLRAQEKETGVKLDPNSRLTAAATVGALEGISESWGTFGILDSWGKALEKSAGKQISREVMMNLGKNILYSVGGEGNEEFWNSIGQDLVRKSLAFNPDAGMTIPEQVGRTLQRAGDAFLVGAASGGVLTVPVGTSQVLYSHRQAILNKETYLKLGQQAQESKLKERAPEVHSEFVEQVVKDTPLEKITIPVEKLDALFQSENVNPALAMKDLGVLKEYEDAKEAGGDVSIPMKTWLEKMGNSPLYQKVADDISFEANGQMLPSLNETRQELEQVKKEAEQLAQQDQTVTSERKAAQKALKEKIDSVVNEIKANNQGKAEINEKQVRAVVATAISAAVTRAQRNNIPFEQAVQDLPDVKFIAGLYEKGGQALAGGMALAQNQQTPYSPNAGVTNDQRSIEGLASATDTGAGDGRGTLRTEANYGALSANTSPLEQLPASSPGHNQSIRDAARQHAQSLGLPFREQSTYVQANPERGARIAQAYEQMAHQPNDPEVKASYDALIKESLQQYQLVKEMGITVDVIKPGMENPYPLGPRQVLEDINQNKHLWLFPTESGFGTLNETEQHPLLQMTDEKIGDYQLRANDIFRIVHDVFGHAKEGVGFGPHGEENAWQAHVRMYSPLAAKAMTTETRGQNSWVNFGPYGENNRTNQQQTVYADQKAGLLPDWVSTEGLAPDRTKILFQQDNLPQAKPTDISPLGFYSQLQREVQKINFTSMPAAQLINQLKNAQGIKADEIEYSGILNWLDLRAQSDAKKVTKAEVLEFLTTSGVELEQVVQGAIEKAITKNKPSRRSSDDVLHVNNVEWTEEYMSADEVDPDGSIRSDNAYEYAREAWRNQEDEERIAELTKEIEDEYPNLSEAKKLAKVEEKYIEEKVNSYEELETQDIESGESIYSILKITIDGIDEDDMHIRSDSNGHADLYVNGDYLRVGTNDPNELKVRAIERLVEDGLLSDLPSPDTSKAQALQQWQTTTDEDGNKTHTLKIDFDNGDEGELTLEEDADGNLGEVHLDDVLARQMGGDDTIELDSSTFEAGREELLNYLVDQGVLREGFTPVAEVVEQPQAPMIPSANEINKPSKAAQWEELTLKGGENYRIFLIKLRPKEGTFTQGHFEDNVLVHVRVKERITKDGKRVLFIEEWQSDWHQKGRDYGYMGTVSEADKAEAKRLRDEAEKLVELYKTQRKVEEEDAAQKYHPLYEKEFSAQLDKIKKVDERIGALEAKNAELDKKRGELEGHVEKANDVWSRRSNALGTKLEALLKASLDGSDLAYYDVTTVNRWIDKGFAENKFNDPGFIPEFISAVNERYNGNEDLPKIQTYVQNLFSKKSLARLKAIQNKYNELKPLRENVDRLRKEASDLYYEQSNIRDEIRAEKKLKDFSFDFPSTPVAYVKEKDLVDRTKSNEIEAQSESLRNQANKLDPETDIPDAPFKTSTQWFSLALKRMLSVAQQGNYDMVAWTPGKVQVDRYNKARYVDSISYKKVGEQYQIKALTKNGSTINQGPFEAKKLGEVVGKDVAKMIIEDQGQISTKEDLPQSEASELEGFKTIKGSEFAVGDHGHMELYDVIFRNAAKDVLKKLSKDLSLTVKQAEDVFGEKLKEQPHNYRNKDQDLEYNDFWAIDLNDAAKAQIAEKGLPLFQSEQQKALGVTIMDATQRFIGLSEKANVSTMLHEMTHYWTLQLGIDYRSLKAMSPDQLTDGQKSVIKLGDDLLKYLGVNSFEEITTEMHEKIARGGEAYFMTGKAPSLALRDIFQNLKVWLTNIYKHIKNLGGEVNPELSSFFDRIIATDEEIALAQYEQNTPDVFSENLEAFGLTGKKRERFLKAKERVAQHAQEKLLTKVMEAFRRQRTKEYKDQWKAIYSRVEQEVNQMPVYRALSILQNGELPGGGELDALPMKFKLSKEILDQFYDPEIVKRLPKGITVRETERAGRTLKDVEYTSGVHPDMAAQFLGYKNGAELIYALAGAEKKEDLITRMTDQELKQTYPDLLDNEEELKKQAEAALKNQSKSKLLRMHLELLLEREQSAAKDMIRQSVKRLPSDAQVKSQAKSIIGKTQVKDVKPHVFLRAEKKAATDAANAVVRGDDSAAWEFKKKELLNHELYRAALEAQEKIKKSKDLFDKLRQKDQDLAKTRDLNYVNAARAILQQFGLGRANKTAQDYVEQIRQYDPEAYASFYEIIRSLESVRGNYQMISYDAFDQMLTLVRALWDQSKSSREQVIDGQRFTKEQIKQALMNDIARKNDTIEAGKKQAITIVDKFNAVLLGVKAQLSRVEAWANYMGEGFKKFIFQPISEAASRYREQRKDVISKFLDILKKIEPTLTTQKIAAPEIGYTFDGKAELLGALLHTGNESNFQKLLIGREWGTVNEDGSLNSDRFMAMIRRLQAEGVLTKADYDFAQETWDLLDSLKPQAQKVHKRLFGFYFAEISAKEIITPFGVYRGGYVPAVVSLDMAPDAVARTEADQIINNDNSFMFPSANKGFTQKREQLYNKPLELNLRLVTSHIDKVLKFVHLAEPVKQAASVILDREMRGALDQFDSRVVNEMLVPWLQRVVSQQTGTPSKTPTGRFFDGILKHLRSNTSLQLITFNITNYLENVGNLSVATTKVRPALLARSLKSYISNPNEFATSVVEKSLFMKNRTTTEMNEIQRAIDDLVLNRSKFGKAKDFITTHAHAFQGSFNHTIDLIVWGGAYDQAIEKGLSEVEATREADSIVRLTQSSFNAEDISKIEAGSIGSKMFLQFYGYFNTVANTGGYGMLKIAKELGVRKGAGKLLFLVAQTVTIPAMISLLLAQGFSGKGFDDDEDGEYLDDLMTMFFNAHWRTLMAMTPILGQAGQGFANLLNDKPYDDAIKLSPAISMVEQSMRAPFKVYDAIAKDGDKVRAVKDSLTAIGLLSGLPVLPLAKPITYTMDVMENGYQDGPVDTVRGLVTGKPTRR